MHYKWFDYIPEEMEYVESWLDDNAIKATGLDGGWKDFYEYWKDEGNSILGVNYWCKIVFESNKPFAVVAVGLREETINVMELIVDPKERNKGKGTLLLKDMLKNFESIFGCKLFKAEAVIYPSNASSQKAFENAGFVFDYAHVDGDALYYMFQQK